MTGKVLKGRIMPDGKAPTNLRRRAIEEMITEFVNNGARLPLLITVVAINGSLLQYRLDVEEGGEPFTHGLYSEVLAEHVIDGISPLPINVMIIDAAGVAVLGGIDTAGTRH